jgi:hypothetical protein
MDCVKHMLSGGHWKQADAWVQAGKKMRSLLHIEPFVHHHLGWVPLKDVQYGGWKPS